MPELRLALRSLLRQRTFALAVVSTLGLAMGVTTGFFGVIDAVALRPLRGVAAPGLVTVHGTVDGRPARASGFSRPTYRDYRERTRSLQRLEAFVGQGFAVGEEAGGGLVGGQLVSGGFFGLLGTQPLLGRLIAPADDATGAERVAAVSEAFWQRRLGGRADVLGSVLRVNGRPCTIVGIAQAGFRGHFVGFPIDVFLPLAAAPEVAADVAVEDRADRSLELIGRLGPGATLAAAQAEMAGIAADIARQHPSSHAGRGVELHGYTGFDPELRAPVIGFVTLLGVVGLLVLLVACVNVGGLVLARATARRRELAVRAALGASPARVVRPLLIEIVVLFAAGGVAGAALAGPSARALHAFLPEFPIPLHLDVSPDWRVALFAGALTVVTALAFGLAPARGAARVDVVEALKAGGRGVAGASHVARRAIVGAQVGLSVVLLVGALLFLREMERARTFDPGFRIDDVALVTVDPSPLGRNPTERRSFFEAWLQRVRSLPRVEAASLVRTPPLGFSRPTTRVRVDGVAAAEPEGLVAGWNAVAPGYFDVVGIPLVAGRDFDAGDAAGTQPVAIASRATAARLFPGGEAVGRHFRHEDRVVRVVGVVGDVALDRSGARDGLFVYFPVAQRDDTRLSLVLRAAPPFPLAAARREARALEPEMPVLAALGLRDHAAAALFPQRLAATVAAAFGGFALFLAGVGLYGVAAFLAEKQRHELAVRAALGARPADLRGLVLRRGLAPALAGAGAGLAGALALGRLAAGFVSAVGPYDPQAYLGGAAVIAAVSLLAVYLPARRAAAVRPADLLQDE
jgi:predicted permease